MKTYKYIIYFFLLTLVISSCKDDNGYKQGEDRPWVRIHKPSIDLKTEDRYKILVHALFDSEATAQKKFIWSVDDPSIVKIETNEDNTVTVIGLEAGKTYLNIASIDGQLKFTSALDVRKAPNFEPIYIDFGPIESGKPFNNFKRPADHKLENLLDSNDENLGYAIEIVGSFNDFEIIRDIPNTLGFPATATTDMFFNDGKDVASAGFVLSNLNKDWKYTFVFYSSINDSDTESEYIVKGEDTEAKAQLITANNTSNVAIIRNILPNDEGKIDITLQAGPNNRQWAKFYNINAMVILAENDELSFPLSFD